MVGGGGSFRAPHPGHATSSKCPTPYVTIYANFVTAARVRAKTSRTYTTGNRETTPFFLSATCKSPLPSGAVAVNESCLNDIPDSRGQAPSALHTPGLTATHCKIQSVPRVWTGEQNHLVRTHNALRVIKPPAVEIITSGAHHWLPLFTASMARSGISKMDIISEPVSSRKEKSAKAPSNVSTRATIYTTQQALVNHKRTF